MANDIFKDFKARLNEAIFDHMRECFPEFNFQQKGDKWISSRHLLYDKVGSKDQTYASPRYGFMLYDNNGDKKGFIDYYMEQHSLSFVEAEKALAPICGLTYPVDETPEAQEKRKRQYREAQQREEANSTYRNALYSGAEGAKEVLAYLHSRGWSDDEIVKAELGYIDEPIKAATIPSEKQKAIGTTHRLTIPYRNRSEIIGFKFRDIHYKEEEAALRQSTGNPEAKLPYQKYLNNTGMQMSGHLFGLQLSARECIIVEGELDALHAAVKGIPNIVATSGGAATFSQIEEAIKKSRTNQFTLLFDTDERGQSFIEPSIKAIEAAGGEAWIAYLPTDVKDTDEYLASHSVEEFNRTIKAAIPSYIWKLNKLVDKYSEIETTQGVLYDKDRTSFYGEFAALLNSPSMKPENRERLKQELKAYETSLMIKLEDVEKFLDSSYFTAYQQEQAKQLSKTLTEANERVGEALRNGNTEEALRLLKEAASTEGETSQIVEFTKEFAPMSKFDFEELLRTIPKGLPTGYRIGRVELTLQAGLTLVCAYTSHGKTTFLNNLMLHEAERIVQEGNGERLLYLSYEIDKRRLLADLINTYNDDTELSNSPDLSPLFVIYNYFQNIRESETVKQRYFNAGTMANGLSHYQNFLQNVESFYSRYLSSGVITIVDKSYPLGKLLSALRYYLSICKPTSVFLDYAQLIYKEGQSRQRTEEIKEIVIKLKEFANENGLPIIMAAQTNRQIDSPLDLTTKNIGEGGDLERIADTVIGIFNLEKLSPTSGGKDFKDELKRLLNRLLKRKGDTKIEAIDKIPNRMYLKLLKRRNEPSGEDTILNWDGRTKRVYPDSAPTPTSQSSKQPTKSNNTLPF